MARVIGVSDREPIQERANQSYENAFGKDGYLRELVEAAEDFDGDPDRHEQAMDELQEGPLSFQKLTTYHSAEEIEWEILLGTGGPARRVIVRTDLRGWRIESATFQFQDWFEPWTSAENQDEDIVRRYAQLVGYYEDDSAHYRATEA